jgi:SAM-dependent methyltransferase
LQISPTGGWTDTTPIDYGVSVALGNWIVGYLGGDLSVPVHDLGCGSGFYSARLRNAGFTRVTGYEYEVPQVALFTPIIAQDLSRPFTVVEPGHVLFLEVGEHIPAEYQETVMDNVAAAVGPGCKLVASWAELDQPGDGHVNCLPNETVIAAFEARGLLCMLGPTSAVRQLDHRPCPWFTDTLMIFRRPR